MTIARTESKYTARLIKASGLIPDTRILLHTWDLSLDVSGNLDRARRENIFGKASRARVEDILRIFRQRYFQDPGVGRALVRLEQGGAPEAWLTPLLYFFSAQNDRTLRDIVLEVVLSRRTAGHTVIDVDHVERQLRAWVADGSTARAWNEATLRRVAQGAMATLRDFDVLRGDANKEIAPTHLPIAPAALIAFWLSNHHASGHGVLHSPEWQLFFLSVEGVEHMLIRAQQQHLLTYQSLGSVIRLDFQADSLEEYARVLVERET